MAKIGKFTANADGSFTGEIITLSVQSKEVRIVPAGDQANANAPSHVVMAGSAEIGAAWPKRSGDGRAYLGVKLDDPSFAGPIYANLFEDADAGSHVLVWTRQRRFRD